MVSRGGHGNAWVSPFHGVDVGQLLLLQAARNAHRSFLTWTPFDDAARTWTYAAFADDVARIAAGLAGRGIGRGSRVLLHLENCPEFLLAWHALARLGAVAVASNARASAQELAYFAAHSGAVAAVTQPRLVAAFEGCQQLRWLAVTDHDAGAAPAATIRPARGDSFAGLYGDAAAAPAPPRDGALPVGIQYTSGSTAKPKGVVWTHDNALWGASVSARHEGLLPDDVHLVTLPLFHVIAAVYSVLASLWAGAHVVLQPRFSATRFWDTALAHRCTWASLVPFCTRALGERPIPESHSFRRWGHAFLSSALEQQFAVPLLGWWGMTEVITHGIVSDSRLPGRDGAIGRPAPEYQAVVLREDGVAAAPGETGELRLHGIPGLSLFREYLDDPGATDAAFDERGFFITGDRVTLNEDGTLKFAGRIRDMLKVGGENVSALEVERVIAQVPGVLEAAVVARPDALRGEVPVAFVVPARRGISSQALAAAVVERCRAALADFKVPHEVRVVSELPLGGGTGKIAKGVLRERLAAEQQPDNPDDS